MNSKQAKKLKRIAKAFAEGKKSQAEVDKVYKRFKNIYKNTKGKK